MDPIRPGLLALAAAPAVQAGWMLAAPRGFYDAFPGAGRSWLPPLGPYAEHLVRDIGAAQLGLAGWLLDRTFATPTPRSSPWPASTPSPPPRAARSSG